MLKTACGDLEEGWMDGIDVHGRMGGLCVFPLPSGPVVPV